MTPLTSEEIDILVAARNLLTDINCWCVGGPSCDEFGNRVKPTDPRARWWCAVGAIARFSPGGLIPYSILRHVDKWFVVFEPVLSRDWGFETVHDQAFDHDRLLKWFEFILNSSGMPFPPLVLENDLTGDTLGSF